MLRDGRNRPRVSHIQHIHILIDDQNYDGTRPRFVMRLVWRWTHKLEEVILSLVRALPDGLWDVAWKLGLQYHIVMKIVFEILGTFTASMAIVHSEYLKFRPLLRWDLWYFLGWLYDIENDGDSIFVGLPHDTHIGIGCECFNRSERLRADLASLKEWKCALGLVFLEELCHCVFDLLGC
jgi:hypothetical protein